nr:spidroin-2-like [Microcebus murinus]
MWNSTVFEVLRTRHRGSSRELCVRLGREREPEAGGRQGQAGAGAGHGNAAGGRQGPRERERERAAGTRRAEGRARGSGSGPRERGGRKAGPRGSGSGPRARGGRKAGPRGSGTGPRARGGRKAGPAGAGAGLGHGNARAEGRARGSGSGPRERAGGRKGPRERERATGTRGRKAGPVGAGAGHGNARAEGRAGREDFRARRQTDGRAGLWALPDCLLWREEEGREAARSAVEGACPCWPQAMRPTSLAGEAEAARKRAEAHTAAGAGGWLRVEDQPETLFQSHVWASGVGCRASSYSEIMKPHEYFPPECHHIILDFLQRNHQLSLYLQINTAA